MDLGALPPLSGSNSVAYGINDSSQVAGAWGTNNPEHAFVYSNSTVTGLPEPSFASACEARGINSTGQIAGICQDANGNGYLVSWSNGTVTGLARSATSAAWRTSRPCR